MRLNEQRTQTLPVAALLALAMTCFICILTETLPAGLLPNIATGLDVSNPLAGQMVTVYALGAMGAAIPLAVMTQGWPRRHVLLMTIAGFLVFNSVTAFSSSYTLTLIARFFAGASAGLAWSLLTGYARRMVIPALQGRALALAMIGTPLGLSLGVPLGTWLGELIAWRLVFALMSVLSLILMVWVIVKVPNYPGVSKSRQRGLYTVLLIPGVRSILAVIFTWMLAHNMLFTYIAPFVSFSGLADQIDMVLLVFGSASIVGVLVVGRLVQRHLRRTVLASLSIFALVAIVFELFAGSSIVIYAGVFAWGLIFGGAATLLLTALADAADAAGESADIAVSMNVVTWNGAIAGGAIAGGLLLEPQGSGSLLWVVFVLLLISLLTVFVASKHGFPKAGRPVPELPIP